MEEQKQQRDLNTLEREAVVVTVAVALQQSVPLELAQIVVAARGNLRGTGRSAGSLVSTASRGRKMLPIPKCYCSFCIAGGTKPSGPEGNHPDCGRV